jgi:hypothetical protein
MARDPSTMAGGWPHLSLIVAKLMRYAVSWGTPFIPMEAATSQRHALSLGAGIVGCGCSTPQQGQLDPTQMIKTVPVAVISCCTGMCSVIVFSHHGQSSWSVIVFSHHGQSSHGGERNAYNSRAILLPSACGLAGSGATGAGEECWGWAGNRRAWEQVPRSAMSEDHL